MQTIHLQYIIYIYIYDICVTMKNASILPIMYELGPERMGRSAPGPWSFHVVCSRKHGSPSIFPYFSLDLFDSPCPPCSNPIMSSRVESLYLALPNFDVSGAAHRCEKMDREHWLSSREQERHLRQSLAHKDSCDWLSLDLGLILPEKLSGNVEHILQDLQDMCPNTY